jgi:hypothetical protein
LETVLIGFMDFIERGGETKNFKDKKEKIYASERY